MELFTIDLMVVPTFGAPTLEQSGPISPSAPGASIKQEKSASLSNRGKYKAVNMSASTKGQTQILELR